MLLHKNLLLLALTCLFFVGCSTSKGSFDRIDAYASDTTTDKGVRYLLGRGVLQNNEKAFHYFSQAADQNDPFAQNELAYLYAAGKGTKQNYQKAMYYYQKAAAHGLATAQYNLGLMYLYGLGASRNKPLAMKWLAKANQHSFEPAKIEFAKVKNDVG